MMVKVLIFGSISTEAAACTRRDYYRSTQCDAVQAINTEGATRSETTETNSSSANVYDFRQYEVLTAVLRNDALGFLRFASLTAALHRFPFVPVLCRSSITALEKSTQKFYVPVA